MLEAVLSHAEKHQAANVALVRVRIGDLAGVVQEALEFAWEALAEGTPAAGSKLAIERVPIACYCETCAKEFAARAMAYRCPACGKPSATLRRGRELELISIEVN